MDKEYIRKLVKQVIDDMSGDEETLATEINVTGDVAGYDAPLSKKKIKRTYSHDEDDDE